MTASAANPTAKRLYNFSPGPAVLPVPVLERIRDEMLCLPGAGASILELSHRSKQFIEIQENARQRLIRLLNIPESHEVLFLQGGARLQFSMVPVNLLRGAKDKSGQNPAVAQYILTGTWGKYAVGEAKKEGSVETIYDSKATNYDRIPSDKEFAIRDDAAYVHVTTNETIQGVQFQSDLSSPAPLVADCSSDFLYRPLNISKYGLVYACAQKNAGPAGVTVVIIRKDLLERSTDDLPGYLSYKNHAAEGSMWNTPPTFAIYTLGLVAQWLEETIGGLDAMLRVNQEKASTVYSVIDKSPSIFIGHAQKDARSLMNVTFRFPSEELEKTFLKGAEAHGLDSLKGHRSVGGIRASIYNAMPMAGVKILADYMSEFAAKHG
jgi:phosphoserine aminotransferase